MDKDGLLIETVFSCLKRRFGEYVYSVRLKNMIQAWCWKHRCITRWYLFRQNDSKIKDNRNHTTEYGNAFSVNMINFPNLFYLFQIIKEYILVKHIIRSKNLLAFLGWFTKNTDPLIGSCFFNYCLFLWETMIFFQQLYYVQIKIQLVLLLLWLLLRFARVILIFLLKILFLFVWLLIFKPLLWNSKKNPFCEGVCNCILLDILCLFFYRW